MSDKINDERKEEIEKEKKLMETFEEETGKHATWHGTPTKNFKKWVNGEKLYNRDKKRISIYVPEDTKTEWQDFVKTNNNEISSLSDLVRAAVSKFIMVLKNGSGELSKLNPNTRSKISHDLKEPLTSIKAFLQLLLENNNNELPEIQDIFDQCLLLENRIKHLLDYNTTENSQYDILLIDDDSTTIHLLTKWFASKGYSCKGVESGDEGIQKLRNNGPKIVLLDIKLPGINGYEICKIIKSDNDLKHVPVFLLTGFPGFEVENHMEETQADGYILKPFNFSDFDVIFDILKRFKIKEENLNYVEKEHDDDDNPLVTLFPSV